MKQKFGLFRFGLKNAGWSKSRASSAIPLGPNDMLFAAQMAKSPYLAYKCYDWAGGTSSLVDHGSAGKNAAILTSGAWPWPAVATDPDNGLKTLNFTTTLENSTGRNFQVSSGLSFDNTLNHGLTIEYLVGPSVNILGNVGTTTGEVQVGVINNAFIQTNKGGRGSIATGAGSGYSYVGTFQEWRYHLFALTFDGINTWKFYRDGILILTQTNAPVSQSRTSISINGRATDGSRSSRMSNICVYKRGLSAEELLENYNSIGFSLNIAKLR